MIVNNNMYTIASEQTNVLSVNDPPEIYKR